MKPFLTAVAGCIAGLLIGCDAPLDPPVIAEVLLESPTPYLDVGSSVSLSARAVDAAGITVPDAELIWTSSDTLIATVAADGVVTGRSVGDARIRVQGPDSTLGASTEIRVEPAVATIDPWSPTTRMAVGATLTLYPVLTGTSGHIISYRVLSDGTVQAPRSLKYLSSNPDVLEVDSAGTVRGKAIGTSTIRIEAGKTFAELTLTVSAPYSVRLLSRSGTFTRPRLSESGTALWTEGDSVYLFDGSGINSLGAWEAHDLNGDGVIVGCHSNRATVWRSGALSPLPLTSGRASCATAINEAGVIAGYEVRSTFTYGEYTPFILAPGGATLDDRLNFKPAAINSSGLVAGTLNVRYAIPYRWDGVNSAVLVKRPSPNYDTVVDLNDHATAGVNPSSGDPFLVDGDQLTPRSAHPYFFTFPRGCPQRIFPLFTAINNQSTIAGRANCHGGIWEGALFHALDLIAPAEGWRIMEAVDINDRGQVLALGLAADGTSGLLLLTPPN